MPNFPPKLLQHFVFAPTINENACYCTPSSTFSLPVLFYFNYFSSFNFYLGRFCWVVFNFTNSLLSSVQHTDESFEDTLFLLQHCFYFQHFLLTLLFLTSLLFTTHLFLHVVYFLIWSTYHINHTYLNTLSNNFKIYVILSLFLMLAFFLYNVFFLAC